MKHVVFTINQNKLADTLATSLKAELGVVDVSYFQDGEVLVKSETPVHGKDVVVLQSITSHELDIAYQVLLLCDSLRNAGARTITWIIPYIPYFRQEFPKEVEPQSSKLIAGIIDAAKVDKIITCDVHVDNNLTHFATPIENVSLYPVFGRYYREYFKKQHIDLNDVVVVSPDNGGTIRAKELANDLGCTSIALSKQRDKSDSVKKIIIHDRVEGKVCLIFDDIISTGHTLSKTASLLLEHGAKSIVVAISHPIISENCTKILKSSQISNIIVANTIEKDLDPLYKVVDIAPLLKEVL
ncbi:MAG: ribose-phosphate diphosphokinase [Coprobacillus sp.]|nr:ribose-phosphate diphosphokinase [Coprobacillus sp.]